MSIKDETAVEYAVEAVVESVMDSAAPVAAKKPQYFDLHTTGVGYLSRFREVRVKKGASFHAVAISALRGTSDNVEYTRFDCRVSGSEALKVLTTLKPHIEAQKKVLIGFKIGDLYADSFVYDKGEKKGQTGISLKTHLLRITFAKVDGKTVYQPPREAPPVRQAA